MRRLGRLWRRQCSSWALSSVGLRCQRRAGHDEPHGASYSARSTMHHSWADGADFFGYRWLPGTIRYRPTLTRSRAFRVGEWTVSVLLALLLWWAVSLVTAIVFLIGELWLSVRRPHFVDVGRFTAGVFFVSRKNSPPSFAVGFTRYGPEADARRSGLQVSIGRRSLMVCALLPRDEWADYKRRNAEREARRKDSAR
ncbi:hypothetical protein ACFY1J_05400 [Streptomyces sp. NPDC001406]|uniref:hypothetical protein n=1 Tax=Streptomyces sp. NPDC001406 TaxID=3364572 RepID=UPI0036AB0F62